MCKNVVLSSSDVTTHNGQVVCISYVINKITSSQMLEKLYMCEVL
jgi:hypothetical protein